MQRRKRGDKSKGRGPGRREGAQELMGCKVTFVRAVYSACESYTAVHLPISPPSPAWQGAGTA